MNANQDLHYHGLCNILSIILYREFEKIPKWKGIERNSRALFVAMEQILDKNSQLFGLLIWTPMNYTRVYTLDGPDLLEVHTTLSKVSQAQLPDNYLHSVLLVHNHDASFELSIGEEFRKRNVINLLYSWKMSGWAETVTLSKDQQNFLNQNTGKIWSVARKFDPKLT